MIIGCGHPRDVVVVVVVVVVGVVVVVVLANFCKKCNY
jgi:hypothetical protein